MYLPCRVSRFLHDDTFRCLNCVAHHNRREKVSAVTLDLWGTEGNPRLCKIECAQPREGAKETPHVMDFVSESHLGVPSAAAQAAAARLRIGPWEHVSSFTVPSAEVSAQCPCPCVAFSLMDFSPQSCLTRCFFASVGCTVGELDAAIATISKGMALLAHSIP